MTPVVHSRLPLYALVSVQMVPEAYAHIFSSFAMGLLHLDDDTLVLTFRFLPVSSIIILRQVTRQATLSVDISQLITHRYRLANA